MPTRRQILQGLLATGAVGAGTATTLPGLRAADDGPRFLVVIGCFGGASMLDCFMPLDEAETSPNPERGTVISYPTVQPEGSAIRCVDRDIPVEFLERFGAEAVVLGTQGSSVNHWVAQARSVNGRDVFNGRTMTEAVAAAYGADRVLPNVNMGRGGYSAPGADQSLPPRYRAEGVTNPVTFPLSTSGSAGIIPLGDTPAQDPETRAAMLERARAFRADTLETQTPFAETFAHSETRRDLLWARSQTDPDLEMSNLLEELFFVPDLGTALPLSAYGISPSEEVSRIRSLLPDAMPEDTSGTPGDRLQAQAALTYLLLKTGASCAVTMTEPGTDGFLAFDLSHTDHRSAQAAHWDRVLDTAGRLIELLRGAAYVDPDGAEDGTLWDRTMIVFATEFGRDKWDTGGSFGTGHHLNNGLLVVSPLLRGNQALGEPDPNNGFICGFDADDGTPTHFDDLAPGEDPLFSDARLPPGEDTVYGALLDVLGIQFDGQATLPVLKA